MTFEIKIGVCKVEEARALHDVAQLLYAQSLVLGREAHDVGDDSERLDARAGPAQPEQHAG